MAWNNHVAVLGDITGDIYYDVLQISNQSVPFLRVYMMINETREAREVKGLRIVFYGVLAELAEWQQRRTAASQSWPPPVSGRDGLPLDSARLISDPDWIALCRSIARDLKPQDGAPGASLARIEAASSAEGHARVVQPFVERLFFYVV